MAEKLETLRALSLCLIYVGPDWNAFEIFYILNEVLIMQGRQWKHFTVHWKVHLFTQLPVVGFSAILQIWFAMVVRILGGGTSKIFDGDVPCWEFFQPSCPRIFREKYTLSRIFFTNMHQMMGFSVNNRPIFYSNMYIFWLKMSNFTQITQFCKKLSFTTIKIPKNFKSNISPFAWTSLCKFDPVLEFFF